MKNQLLIIEETQIILAKDILNNHRVLFSEADFHKDNVVIKQQCNPKDIHKELLKFAKKKGFNNLSEAFNQTIGGAVAFRKKYDKEILKF
jgi:hypothetical protein